MAATDPVKQLEKRLAKLESHCGLDDRDEIRRLWSSVRKERDVEVLFKKLKKAARGRKPPKRAQIHGTIDTLVANGDDVLPATPTVIVASSEPCGILVATIITLTICD
jgi:hypothetical protein